MPALRAFSEPAGERLWTPAEAVSAKGCQMAVDLCPQEQDADTEIQPEHQDGKAGEASVHGGKAGKIFKIEGGGIGKQDPAEGGKHGSRKLASEPLPLVRKKGVQPHKKDYQDYQRQHGTQADQVRRQSLKKGQNLEYKILDNCTEYQQDQGQNADRHKHNGVA